MRCIYQNYYYRPQLRAMDDTKIVKQISVIMETWLKDTQEDINKGLKKCLELITNVKALHIIREESLKIGLYIFLSYLQIL